MRALQASASPILGAPSAPAVWQAAGNISYEPANHSAMVHLRAAKIAGIEIGRAHV